jgi:hypothetical protein
LLGLVTGKCVDPAVSGGAPCNIAMQEPTMRMLGTVERSSDRIRTDLGTDGPH